MNVNLVPLVATAAFLGAGVAIYGYLLHLLEPSLCNYCQSKTHFTVDHFFIYDEP